MDIYRRIYDNPYNEDWSEKDNELLWTFDLLDWDMDDYSYDVIVRSRQDGKIYILHWQEISFKNWWTKHTLSLLEDNYFVKSYISHEMN